MQKFQHRVQTPQTLEPGRTPSEARVRAWPHAVISFLGQRVRGGGGQAPAFRVARCQTRSHVDGRLGPVGARQGSSATPSGQYLSRTPIRVHRVFRQGSSGAVGPYRLKSGFRRVSVGSPIWHDRPRRGLTGRSTVPYWYATKIRTLQGPYGSPTGRQGPRWDPTGPRRPAGGTVGPRFTGAPRFGGPMRPSLLSA